MSRLKTLTVAAAIAVSAFGLAIAPQANAETDFNKTSSQTTIQERTDITNTIDFSTVDENSDGKITEQEFSNSVDADTSAESFAELDQNKDGTLDLLQK